MVMIVPCGHWGAIAFSMLGAWVNDKGLKADTLGLKNMEGGISFDAPLFDSSVMRLPEMSVLPLRV